MIWNCFPFFDELDLLELRLAELSGVIDKFVVVEGSRTFAGKFKPLHYWTHRQRFAKWNKQIVHVVVDDLPPEIAGVTRWEREWRTCAKIADGLTDAKADDVLLLCYADEIPRSEYARMLATLAETGPAMCGLRNYCLFLNGASDFWAWGPIAVKPSDLPPNGLREVYRHWRGGGMTYAWRPERHLGIGGWHFSYLGGVAGIRAKVGAFSHAELDNSKTLSDENLLRCLNSAVNLNGIEVKYVPLDNTFPQYLRDHQEQFSHLMSRVKLCAATAYDH